MKNCYQRILVLCLMFFQTAVFAQHQTEKYYDQNDQELTFEAFEKLRRQSSVTSITIKPNHKKIVDRLEAGELTNHQQLIEKLQKAVGQPKNVDWQKPLVILYYPGIDWCNSSGSATKNSRKIWFGELEIGIKKIAQTQPIYIYKNAKGLEKYDGIMTWHKDPEAIIQKTFFKHHYPCGSFVIINPDGKYASYFGEYSQRDVWDVLRALMNTNQEN